MGLIVAVVALILGILLVTAWAVSLLVKILGFILIAAAVIWFIRYLAGRRKNRADL